MRVALVCAHAGSPSDSDGPAVGTHQHVARVAAELTERGHDVRVYQRRETPGLVPAVEQAGYRLVRVPIGPAARTPTAELVPLVPEFSRWLETCWAADWTPDIVHGHFWIGGVVAASAVRNTTIPVVQTFHSVGAEQMRRLRAAYAGPAERIPLEVALTRVVDAAVALSTDEVDELTRMGLQRAAVMMVPPGVDTTRFSPEGEVVSRESRPRILSVGRLGPGHGQEDLIRAMRLVGDAELVIAGGSVGNDTGNHAEVRRLRELADQAGVAGQVRLVGGLRHDHLPAWYRSADVVACTPRYASAGQVPLEAMACGVPVVGYALGGVADTVVDQVTGRLVAPGDVRGLGVTLRRLLADDASRFAYGHAAVDRVRCSYTWERTVGALERLYERVTRHRQPPVEAVVSTIPVAATTVEVPAS